MAKINNSNLYLVISSEYGLGRPPYEIADSAIKGGVDIIQLREKNKAKEELLKLSSRISELCRKSGVTFIINDDPFIARDSNADGVHLGQQDLQKYGIGSTRKILGDNKIIGVSTHSPEELLEADKAGADYLAYGPIFPTKTKDYHIGTKEIRKVLGLTKKPLFFIGGINLTNINEILGEGAKGIALIRGILEAEDITEAAKNFKRILKDGEERNNHKG